MASPTAGNRRLTVTLAADVASFQKGLHAAQKTLEATARNMIAIGQNLAFSIGLPLAGISTAVVKLAGNLESAQTKIVTQTNVTRAQVDELSGSFRGLSEAIGMTQTKITEGALAVAGAGFKKTAQVLELTELAAHAAAAGFGDMAELSRTAVTVMTAFRKQGVTALDVMNAFVLAVKEGNFPAQQWAEAMADVASLGAAGEIGMLQLTAAISAYSRITGDAIKASIGFRGVIIDIFKPNKKAEEFWAKLLPGGIEEMRRLVSEDMVGAFKKLGDTLNELPLEKRTAIATRLFDDSRAALAFLGTFSSMGDQIIEIYNGMVGRMPKALETALNEIRGEWDHVWRLLSTAVINLGADIGKQLLPMLKTVGVTIAAWATVLTPVIVSYAQLAAKIALVTVGSISFMVALGTIALAIAAVTKAVYGLIAAFSIMGGLLVSALTALGTTLLGVLATFSGAIGTWATLTIASVATIAVAIAALGAVGTEAHRLLTDQSRTTTSLWDYFWRNAINKVHIAFLEFFAAVTELMLEFQHTYLNVMTKVNETAVGDLLIPDSFLSVQRGIADDLFSLYNKIAMKQEDLANKGGVSLDVPKMLGIDEHQEKVDELIKKWLDPVTLKNAISEFEKSLGGAKIDMGKLLGLEEGDEKGAKKAASALDKIFDVIKGGRQELAALQNGWTEFEKGTMDGIATIAEAAADGLIPREIVEAAINEWVGLRKEIERTPNLEGWREIQDILTEQELELRKLQHVWTDFQAETRRGLIQIEQVAAQFKLPIDEVERMKAAYLSLRFEIEKQNRLISIDMKGTLLSALEGITRGLFQGTLTWRSLLDSFADIGVGIFIDLFRQIIEAKVKELDIKFEANIDELQKALEILRGEVAATGAAAADAAREAIERSVENEARAKEGLPPLPTQPGSGTIGTPGPRIPGGSVDPGWVGTIVRELKALGDWLSNIWDELQGAFAQVRDWVMEGTNEILAFLMAQQRAAAKTAKKLAIANAIGSIAGAIGGASGGAKGAPKAGNAEGGIFRRPTYGLFAEAGPEAILPLSDLGKYIEPAGETQVVVNSPHPATVKETRTDDKRMIEVVIEDALARSIRYGGKASRAMESAYGMRRVGGTR